VKAIEVSGIYSTFGSDVYYVHRKGGNLSDSASLEGYYVKGF